MTEHESQTSPSGLSRNVLVVVWLTVLGLIAWFFFAWLFLDRHVMDAAGESIGSGLLMLLLLSITGMVVRRR